MKTALIYLLVLSLSFLLYSFARRNPCFAEEERKTLLAEEAAEAQKLLEKAQKILKKAVKNVPHIANAGSISGVVTCKRSRTNANAIVYIEKVGNTTFEPPSEHAVVDQLNLTYVPHVIAIQKGTVVDFPNSDAVRHNVFSPPGAAFQFNLGTYPTGVVKEVLFDVVGETPLLCNVHAEMSGFIVSFANPYFAVTDKEGTYSIEGVPPGKYVVKTWHESLKSISKEVVVVANRDATVNFDLKRRR